MRFRVIYLTASTMFFMLGAFAVNAQEPAWPGAETVQQAGPVDVLNRGTPLGSIEGFLQAAVKPDWEEAAEFLDLRNLPDDVRALGGDQPLPLGAREGRSGGRAGEQLLERGVELLIDVGHRFVEPDVGAVAADLFSPASGRGSNG